jgi:5-methylcytosine-specific restriction endonuclease McrA
MAQTCQFIAEYISLKQRERGRLVGATISLPLSDAIEALKKPLKGSTSRFGVSKGKVPVTLYRAVCLGPKLRDYRQPLSGNLNIPLCLMCESVYASQKGTPTQFRDLFCSSKCMVDYSSISSGTGLRRAVRQRDRGVCDKCGRDMAALVERLKSLTSEADRIELLVHDDTRWIVRAKQKNRLVQDPREGLAWEADHVVAVADGGGQCTADNMRTLCVPCHLEVTREQWTSWAGRPKKRSLPENFCNKQPLVPDANTLSSSTEALSSDPPAKKCIGFTTYTTVTHEKERKKNSPLWNN